MKKAFRSKASKFRSFKKGAILKVKKHAPEILLVTGIIATGAAIVTACKATRKLDKIIDEHKENLDKINISVEETKTFIDDDGKEKKYTKEVAKTDKFCTYRDTAFRIVKTYAVPAALFIGGVTCFVASTVILKKREKASLALFNGSLAAFNAYRSKIRDAVGEEAESKIYHGIDEVKVTDIKADGTSEEKIIKQVDRPHNVYTFRMNSQTCRFWESDMKYNLMFARSVEEDIDNLVFGEFGGEPVELNAALKKLGMLKCGAMMGEGWVPEKLGGKVKRVSFGLEKYTLPDEEGGVDIMDCDEILLEFNCEHIMDKF